MYWLNVANEIHRRHCDTEIEIAEKRRQETLAKAAKDSIEAVAGVAQEMVKHGESKEARKLINETIRGMGEINGRLNDSSEPRKVYYLE